METTRQVLIAVTIILQEHREPREDDKVIDKIITNSDRSNDDAVYDTDERDEIDKLDDIRQVEFSS